MTRTAIAALGFGFLVSGCATQVSSTSSNGPQTHNNSTQTPFGPTSNNIVTLTNKNLATFHDFPINQRDFARIRLDFTGVVTTVDSSGFQLKVEVKDGQPSFVNVEGDGSSLKVGEIVEAIGVFDGLTNHGAIFMKLNSVKPVDTRSSVGTSDQSVNTTDSNTSSRV
ncbi:MAG: hypothetical protein IRY98_11865 [Alicyclobacillaceae bacterium]|nr:hypothetical protein [Alicyclobacillaceae bacterium]